MATFTARRRENIKQNEILLREIKPVVPEIETRSPRQSPGAKGVKRKANSPRAPTRQSRRIAEATTKPNYESEEEFEASTSRGRGPRRKATKRAPRTAKRNDPESEDELQSEPSKDIQSIIAGWTSWEPEAGEPVRDAAGTFRFESHPDFQPNKSPEEIIREGSFGGSYWRPLFSKRLRITVQDDWRELPASWTSALDADRFLTSASYDPEVNKYGVACGQSIEEWEAAGWIAHDYDVRGWFQWYCRFWMGRRCADDERQIGRWRKCVGETGRWRRILLKKYVALGIHSVFADESGDDEEGVADVSPVVHQTCHHWAYEVRQDALERFWAEGK